MPIKLKTRAFTAYLFLTACSLLGAANTPPMIEAVQPFYGASVMVDHPTLYKFYISDPETAPSNLQLSFASSNPALFPTTNAVFHWFLHDADGQHWYLTLVPAFGQTGTATNTLTVSDGTNSVSTNFVITVTPPPPGAARFVNTSVISIPDVGAATPYPSANIVTGMIGTITNLTLTLSKINHQYIKDVHMLLVGPTGRGMVVFSRISSVPVTDITATLLDAAPDWSPLPPDFELWSEQFRPADYATNNPFANNFPAPAPAGPYAPTLFANAFSNAFNGLPANGTWSLYIYDESAPSHGDIVGGWSLMIATDGGSAAPTISDIANQLTTVNTATAAIPFTVNDTDTPVNNLTLSKSSSNTTLVPTNNIVFGGSGANRTVTVTPATGLSGTATITVTVSDGTSSSSDSFLLTVNAVNTPPTLTRIVDQTINEDTSTAALSFTVGDAETAAGSLTLSRGSSNPTLVPTNSIVFGGSGANRAVTVSPATNQSGTATITVSVSDGQYVVSTNFVVTVTAVNDAPTITGIANQTINVGATTGPLAFTIGDMDTAVGSLTLSPNSSNPTLAPLGSIVLAGSGANRTVTVTPAAGQSGTATITVSVNDGDLSASNSFVLTVSSLLAGTQSFTNSNAITIPSVGVGTPYPSVITVAGMGGTITTMTVTLRNLSHTWADDVDVLLVGPGGQTMRLMENAGTGPTANANLTFSNNAAAVLPQTGALATGNYKPTAYAPATTYPAPAPTGPYGTNFSVFNGTTPNGTWSLYIIDDGAGDQGSLASGWSLAITTTGGAAAAAVTVAATDPTAGEPGSGQGTGTFTFTRTGSTTAALTVNYTVGGTASSGNDYTSIGTTVTFAAGAATTIQTVSVLDDALVEGDETLVLTLAAGSDYTVGSPAAATVTINDDDGAVLPAVTVAATDATAAEPGDPGTFTFSRTGSTTAALTVNYTVGGTAASGTDYTALGTTVAFAAGSATAIKTVSVLDDALVEGAETVGLTLAAGTGYTVGSPASATVTIADNETPTAGTQSFTNTAAITIPDAGAGTPYPSVITVSGLGGTISNMTLTLRNLSHTWGNDIDVLLVGPGGQAMRLMENAGTGSTANNANLTFSNSATAVLPQTGALISGNYKPTAYAPATTYPAPAPTGPYGTNFNVFNGTTPNGAWSLYVLDDGPGDLGSFAAGWSLTISTAGAAARSSVAAEQPPQITAVTFDDRRGIQVTVSGQVGLSYALEASSDFSNWSKVDVQDNITGSIVFNEQPTNSFRFYRAVSVPK